MLLRGVEEENTIKGLRKIKEKQNVEINVAEIEIDRLNKEIVLLQEEIMQQNINFKDETKHRQLLSDLYEKGIIDENGNYVDDVNNEN